MELITVKISDETLQIILDIALSAKLMLIDCVGKKVCYVGKEPGTLDLEKWNDAVRIDTIDERRCWLTEDIVGRPVDIWAEQE